jgi:hypothetical protein
LAKYLLKKLRQYKWFPIVLVTCLILLTLGSRICVAYFLANDDPGDGKIYAQLATNLLEQKVYSLETEAPFDPTLVRLPGYPLFIAVVYTVFGHGNNTAVRVVQAVFDTATCVIVAALAWEWTEDETRKKKTALWAFLIAALCPFIVIYAATLLTETLATFFMAAMALTATYAFKSQTAKKSLLWWFVTGLLGGWAVFLRPDSGLFAAGIGLALVVSGLFTREENAPGFGRRLFNVGWRGAVFSLAFILMLVPWTIRNYQVFHLFQPLSPAHAEMPGEFVSQGYNRWLRTWVDDERFVEPMLWNLNEKPIKIEKIPASAFDSDEERTRAAALLESYNHPPGSEDSQTNSSNAEKADDSDDDDSDDDSGDDSQSDNADDKKDEADQTSDDEASDDDSGDDTKQLVKMTPEIDAGFGEIADQRIDRAPFRYYVSLPLKRAAGMWFATHSLYYPFGGEYSPTDDLDFEEHQEIWLPLFGGLTWIHTLFALFGAYVLWRFRVKGNSLRWLLLIALMTIPRIAFFSSIENPEARYLVELFVFSSVLGGIFIGHLKAGKEVENVASKESSE